MKCRRRSASRALLFVSFTLSVIVVAPTASAAWQGSKLFQACVSAADGNDPKMGDCAREEFGRQDKLLNEQYAVRLKTADPRLSREIVASQRAWLGYRDRTCRAEGAVYDGGTMEPLAFADCQARLTTERLKWLRSLTP